MLNIKCVFVSFISHKSNIWKEHAYRGYCELGGKDYYELLAEMNGKSDREDGIEMYFGENTDGILFPNIVVNIKDWKWKNEEPKPCPHQGHFY